MTLFLICFILLTTKQKGGTRAAEEQKKMKYDLVGVDGNAWSVMGYVARAMENEGMSREEVSAYHYRRLPFTLAMLKSLQERKSEWEHLIVVHYGY